MVTAVFMPLRPDLNGAINKAAAAEARVAKGQNSWVIDTLQPGDVLVVDLYGKIDKGTFIGDNLGTSIFAKTGKGVVVNGSVRDVSGILEIEGFHGFVRDFHPTALADTTLVGINVPIRIGGVTVLPGDVILSDPEGLTFVPPQLAEKVVTSSEDVRFRDDWGHEMLRQGKYTPGQVDSKWTDAMEAEYQAWVKARGSEEALGRDAGAAEAAVALDGVRVEGGGDEDRAARAQRASSRRRRAGSPLPRGRAGSRRLAPGSA